MGAIVSLEQANAHLRLDLDTVGSPPSLYVGSPPRPIDSRGANVELKITAAEALVLGYLKVSGDPFAGSPPAWAMGSPPLWTERQVEEIRAAVLVTLSALFDDAPDRTIADVFKAGGAVPLMLARLRDPAYA